MHSLVIVASFRAINLVTCSPRKNISFNILRLRGSIDPFDCNEHFVMRFYNKHTHKRERNSNAWHIWQKDIIMCLINWLEIFRGTMPIKQSISMQIIRSFQGIDYIFLALSWNWLFTWLTIYCSIEHAVDYSTNWFKLIHK